MDYYLKYDRLSKTKTVIKLYHNNLSIGMFNCENENCHTLNEQLSYKGCVVKIDLLFKTNDFTKLSCKTKNFKIKGFYNDFTLFSRIDVKTFPGNIKGENEFLKYDIRFDGDIKELEKTYQIKRRKEKIQKKQGLVSCTESQSHNTRNEIPSTVRYNISHPFQGGKVSPK